ncbi:MAG TPA: hypothetical protein DD725_11410 [Deltaproteobacteria bacterium]|nr:hypothetical protein [Deltaproteobacteria bacterium]
MRLKFIVDVGVGRAIEDWLESFGYDVLSVREINPRMSDRDILSLAVKEKRIVITMDSDFGELVYHSGQPHAGVLLLRLEGARTEEKLVVAKEILSHYADKLPDHFCVYQNGKLRVR